MLSSRNPGIIPRGLSYHRVEHGAAARARPRRQVSNRPRHRRGRDGRRLRGRESPDQAAGRDQACSMRASRPTRRWCSASNEMRQVAGTVGNDHILEILDMGALPDGERYMVMEFRRRDAHRAHQAARPGLQRRKRPLRVSCSQVLRGLAAAHGAGIVHRDLKPDNIFVLKELSGIRDYVKIIDLGISKFTEGGCASSRHDPDRRAHGHAPLHGARAGDGQRRDRSPNGHLRGRDHSVRIRHGSRAVPGGDLQSAALRDRAREDHPRAAVRAGSRSGVRQHHHAGERARSRAAVPDLRRIHCGAR